MRRTSVSFSKWKDFIPFLLMAFLLAILFWRALFLGDVLIPREILNFELLWRGLAENVIVRNPYPLDAILQQYPWKLFFSEMLSQGKLALWNPYSFCGHPLFASSQAGFLNIFNLLFLFFNFTTAYNLMLILQLYAAGIFAYLYLRKSLRLGRFGSIMGGMFYMLNGVFIVWLEWGWMIGGALWLPLILLFLDKSWIKKSYLYAVIAGIPLAFSFLGGSVQISLSMMFAIALYSSLRAVMDFREQKVPHFFLNSFLIIVISCAVGLCLAAIQFLPTIELLVYSQRNYFSLLSWFKSFPKNFLLSILFFINSLNPYFTGNPQSLDFRNFIQWPTFHGNFVEYQVYTGISALIFTAIALWFNRTKNNRLYLWMGLMTLVLFFATPLNLFLYYRVFFVYAFSIAVLAGTGANHLIASSKVSDYIAKVNKVSIKIFLLFLLILVSSQFILWYEKNSIFDFGRKYVQTHMAGHLNYTNDPNYVFEKFVAFYHNYLMTSPTMFVIPLILMGIMILFFCYSRKMISMQLFRIGLFALVSIELLHFGMSFTPTIERQYLFPPTLTVDFLQKDKSLYRILSIRDRKKDPWIMQPNIHMPYQIQSVTGYDSLHIKRYAELIWMLENEKKEGLEPQSRPIFSQAALLTSHHSKLLDMLNVKYLIVSPTRTIQEDKFQHVFSGELKIYQNKNVLPRAFIVSQAKVIKDRQHLLSALFCDDFDPSREVILEEFPPKGLNSSNTKERSSAEVFFYSPHQIKIRAHLAVKGFLVLGDTYFPGWKAFANGIEIPVYRANYVLRAVFLDKGEKTIEFVYDPWTFKLGKWISFSTFLFILVILSICRKTLLS